jgi:hypothetical protein
LGTSAANAALAAARTLKSFTDRPRSANATRSKNLSLAASFSINIASLKSSANCQSEKLSGCINITC